MRTKWLFLKSKANEDVESIPNTVSETNLKTKFPPLSISFPCPPWCVVGWGTALYREEHRLQGNQQARGCLRPRKPELLQEAPCLLTPFLCSGEFVKTTPHNLGHSLRKDPSRTWGVNILYFTLLEFLYPLSYMNILIHELPGEKTIDNEPRPFRLARAWTSFPCKSVAASS